MRVTSKPLGICNSKWEMPRNYYPEWVASDSQKTYFPGNVRNGKTLGNCSLETGNKEKKERSYINVH